MSLNIYLSGEIHSNWREELKIRCNEKNLSITFMAPVTHHESSDAVGEKILGKEAIDFWKDHKAAKINSIRQQFQMKTADIVIVRFGEKYKQWNAAFDAGYAAALGKPLIVMHAPSLTHPLKEIDAIALAVTENLDQVLAILDYILNQK